MDMLERNDNKHNLFFYKKERNKDILNLSKNVFGSTVSACGSQRF
jgi:hypothetical protein